MECNSCKAKLKGTEKFCPECGQKIVRVQKCNSCYVVLEGNPKFCPECGTKVDNASDVSTVQNKEQISANPYLKGYPIVEYGNTLDNLMRYNYSSVTSDGESIYITGNNRHKIFKLVDFQSDGECHEIVEVPYKGLGISNVNYQGGYLFAIGRIGYKNKKIVKINIESGEETLILDVTNTYDETSELKQMFLYHNHLYYTIDNGPTSKICCFDIMKNSHSVIFDAKTQWSFSEVISSNLIVRMGDFYNNQMKIEVGRYNGFDELFEVKILNLDNGDCKSLHKVFPWMLEFSKEDKRKQLEEDNQSVKALLAHKILLNSINRIDFKNQLLCIYSYENNIRVKSVYNFNGDKLKKWISPQWDDETAEKCSGEMIDLAPINQNGIEQKGFQFRGSYSNAVNYILCSFDQNGNTTKIFKGHTPQYNSSPGLNCRFGNILIWQNESDIYFAYDVKSNITYEINFDGDTQSITVIDN